LAGNAIALDAIGVGRYLHAGALLLGAGAADLVDNLHLHVRRKAAQRNVGMSDMAVQLDAGAVGHSASLAGGLGVASGQRVGHHAQARGPGVEAALDFGRADFQRDGVAAGAIADHDFADRNFDALGGGFRGAAKRECAADYGGD
jgi:hypothetical protein